MTDAVHSGIPYRGYVSLLATEGQANSVVRIDRNMNEIQSVWLNRFWLNNTICMTQDGSATAAFSLADKESIAFIPHSL